SASTRASGFDVGCETPILDTLRVSTGHDTPDHLIPLGIDHLVIDTSVDYWQSEYEQWEVDRGTEWDQGAFVLELAPDYLHKDEVSGGLPYAMASPNAGVDGLFLGEHHATTFTNYLRISFRLAGFPGWDRGELDGWAKNPKRLPPVLVDLAESLLRV
ncbi:MAG: hypothetical protein ACR2JX_03560, partial [Mycobacteriales bacterium]